MKMKLTNCIIRGSHSRIIFDVSFRCESSKIGRRSKNTWFSWNMHQRILSVEI